MTQQKGRRNPIQLQEQVDQEIKDLLEQDILGKVHNINDGGFIQPVVITVKKDGSVKLDIDAREITQLQKASTTCQISKT